MNVTIFGANGFLGRHLVTNLAKNKSLKIRAFGRFLDRSSIKSFQKYTNIELYKGNFFNIEDVKRAVKNTDVVFHLISTTTPATSNNNPLIDIDTNIRPSVELLQACAEQGVQKVVYFSSGGSVYGPSRKKFIKEDTPLLPISPYAIGKVTVEHYLNYFEATHDLDFIVYRIANPYGPGQNPNGKQGIIPIFINRILKNEPITIFGDGEMTRDYIYIDDLVRMVTETFSQTTKHKIYNIGSGRGASVNEITAIIEKISGLHFTKINIEAPSTFLARSVLDITRIKNEFNIAPTVDLETGIKKTWNYINEKIK